MLWPLIDMNSGDLKVWAEVDENDIDPNFVPPEPGETLGGARLLRVFATTSADFNTGHVTVTTGNQTVFDDVVGPNFNQTWNIPRNPRRNIADLAPVVSYRAV